MTDDDVPAFELRGFEVLASDAEARKAGANVLRRLVGPVVSESGEALWSEDPLGDRGAEMAVLELASGFRSRRQEQRLAIQSGRFSIAQLFPDDLAYYSLLIGPPPGDRDQHDYLLDILSERRRTLLSRDLSSGLEVCLPSALCDDLAPWVPPASVDDDSLWTALQNCAPGADPVSLLAAIDLALGRQGDCRFAEAATEWATLLLESSESEGFPLESAVLEVTLDSVNSGELRNQPPYWKRLCAWTHGMLLVRDLKSLGLGESDELFDLLRRARGRIGRIAKSLDFASEPMYSASDFSSSSLSSFFLGRLLQIAARHEAEGTSIPFASQLNGALQKMMKSPRSGSTNFPGPLEGHVWPGRGRFESFGAFPEDLAEKISGLIDEGKVLDAIATLSWLSMTLEIPQFLREAACRALESAAAQNGPSDEIFGAIGEAAIMCLAQRDGTRATFLCGALVAMADRCGDAAAACAEFDILMMAGAALDDPSALAGHLAAIAQALPHGGPSRAFAGCIEALREAVDLGERLHSRAEAIALAGY